MWLVIVDGEVIDRLNILGPLGKPRRRLLELRPRLGIA